MGCHDPSRALVVEDAVNGLKSARGAGAYCVAVTTSLPRHLLQPWADVVLVGLQDLDLTSMHPPGIPQQT